MNLAARRSLGAWRIQRWSRVKGGGGKNTALNVGWWKDGRGGRRGRREKEGDLLAEQLIKVALVAGERRPSQRVSVRGWPGMGPTATEHLWWGLWQHARVADGAREPYLGHFRERAGGRVNMTQGPPHGLVRHRRTWAPRNTGPFFCPSASVEEWLRQEYGWYFVCSGNTGETDNLSYGKASWFTLK